ncbi:hypothetical protein BKA65DRAFT_572136 [Rhexocercosporidium sp. MPI-PUGE-AT-0058]|nr:hypothetical protein BKA65DRAFT_572136 [Rhexocercosporidium sp. MPI-PUGE-AT-0058]
MVSFVKIVMSLALLTVAAASPVTSTSPILGGRTALNGCYGSGPTFADVGFGDSGFIDGACNSLKGGYSSGQRRNYCVNGAHGRINMAAIRFGNKPGADLSYESGFPSGDSALSPFTAGMTTAEDSYEYHLRVVSDAIQSSRNRGAAINTVSLSGFNLPYYHEWEVPELSTLLESLGKLLQSVRVIRLSDSSSPLEVLSRCALDIYQLDMCCMEVKYNVLEDFLETNKRYLRSIGFHDVTITESSRLVSPSGLVLRYALRNDESSTVLIVSSSCLPFRKEGWRMLLNSNDHPQRSET